MDKHYFDLPIQYPYGRGTGPKTHRPNSPHRSPEARDSHDAGSKTEALRAFGLVKRRHGKRRGWEVVGANPNS